MERKTTKTKTEPIKDGKTARNQSTSTFPRRSVAGKQSPYSRPSCVAAPRCSTSSAAAGGSSERRAALPRRRLFSLKCAGRPTLAPDERRRQLHAHREKRTPSGLTNPPTQPTKPLCSEPEARNRSVSPPSAILVKECNGGCARACLNSPILKR